MFLLLFAFDLEVFQFFKKISSFVVEMATFLCKLENKYKKLQIFKHKTFNYVLIYLTISFHILLCCIWDRKALAHFQAVHLFNKTVHITKLLSMKHKSLHAQ